mgnify:CR=1 FL=1
MNIYLMAKYSRHPEMQAVAFHLHTMGHRAISRWILGEHQASDSAIGTGGLGKLEARFAQEDIDDLHAADLCIGFSEPLHTWTRGGRHVELGMALALGKRIVVVGGHEHVFHALSHITHVPDHAALYAYLAETYGSKETPDEPDGV